MEKEKLYELGKKGFEKELGYIPDIEKCKYYTVKDSCDEIVTKFIRDEYGNAVDDYQVEETFESAFFFCLNFSSFIFTLIKLKGDIYMDLKPKKSKDQVLKERIPIAIKKIYNFFECNRNDFMRQFKNNGICEYCGSPIINNVFELHHKTNDHECHYGTIRPRCKECFEKHNEKFRKCAKHLMCVHPGCHRKIHKSKKGE